MDRGQEARLKNEPALKIHRDEKSPHGVSDAPVPSEPGDPDVPVGTMAETV